MLPDTATLATAIECDCGVQVATDHWQPVSGGDINQVFRVPGPDGDLFLKINSKDCLEHFAAESEGLAELSRAEDLVVPATLGTGLCSQTAWLLLEWLDLSGSKPVAAAACGRALAHVHRLSRVQFGWHRDNVIGSTPQRNQDERDWVCFYSQQRLQPQLQLAAANGAPASLLNAGERLCADLAKFFSVYLPVPSLLHGDLWGGNWAALPDNSPVFFDPAVYYGDREADLAMTRLFGGFPDGFYAAYNEAWPLDAGHAERIELYNLYHVLNHFNLFGGGYAAQAEGMLERLLGLI
ncbi:MAG: fructosamine kinase family protein [Gammaproteobacteria bacterium]